jgi:hypothetical protein
VRSFRVVWSDEDGEYAATADDWEMLSWLDPDPVAALRGLVTLVGNQP